MNKLIPVNSTNCIKYFLILAVGFLLSLLIYSGPLKKLDEINFQEQNSYHYCCEYYSLTESFCKLITEQLESLLI